jgi:hypothetical protein
MSTSAYLLVLRIRILVVLALLMTFTGAKAQLDPLKPLSGFLIPLDQEINIVEINNTEPKIYLTEIKPRYVEHIYPPPPPAISDYSEYGEASFYGDFFHGKFMANGNRFNMYDTTIVAHKNLPLGTKIKITDIKTGKSINATVQDRGPYKPGRIVDLSYAAALKLNPDFETLGLINVKITPYLISPIVTFQWPIKGTVMSSFRSGHRALDIDGTMLQQIKPIAAGKIVFVGTKPNDPKREPLGNHIIIDHGYGVNSTYGHLSRIKVKKGDWVTAKTIIGNVGVSGHVVPINADGSHLHIELTKNGKYLNPRTHFDKITNLKKLQ